MNFEIGVLFEILVTTYVDGCLNFTKKDLIFIFMNFLHHF